MIPDAAIVLAGYVLAHAAWSVSDLPDGELLVPLAIVEVSSQHALTRFEAETQAEAIEQGKKYVVAQRSSASSWAFAREGQMKTRTGSVDVIVVGAWSVGMSEPIAFIQPFQPFAVGAFKLLGSAVAVVAGAMLDETASGAHSKPRGSA